MSNTLPAVNPHSALTRLMHKLLGSFVTIFTIHRPTPVSGAYNGLDEQLLEQCLAYATKKNYRFIALDTLIAEALANNSKPQPTICFTLDDGYTDQAERLLPLLLHYKAAPSLFVITDFIDNKLWPWDAKLTYALWHSPLSRVELRIGLQHLSLDLSSTEKRMAARRTAMQALKQLDPALHTETLLAIAASCKISLPLLPPEEFSPVSWHSLRKLEAQGVRIGSHSQSHLIFNSASDSTIRAELMHSKQRLAAELQNPSSVFCYPLGMRQDFSERHIPLVQAAGYCAAISTISNVTNTTAIRNAPFQIQRIAFPNNFEKFVRYTSWKEALRSKLPF